MMHYHILNEMIPQTKHPLTVSPFPRRLLASIALASSLSINYSF
jgi:hypothetical protein